MERSIQVKNSSGIHCIMIIDDKLKFDLNTDIMCKKGQQRLYCLRKLAKFDVDKTLMKLNYCAYSTLSL